MCSRVKLWSPGTPIVLSYSAAITDLFFDSDRHNSIGDETLRCSELLGSMFCLWRSIWSMEVAANAAKNVPLFAKLTLFCWVS